ncbi:hypothetical protein ACIRP0_10845 [Streptomyces sp. NPDC101733]|uniref:hypothetical protein n=1 Tax=unclassified Streptomyces TaxID=2593676 RepID=UPI00382E7A13
MLLLSKSAWDHAPTVVGHRRLIVRRARNVVLLFLPLTAAVFGARLGLADVGVVPSFILALVFFPWLPWAVIALVRVGRVATILRSHPWQELSCQYPRETTTGPETLTVRFDEESSMRFRVVPFPAGLARRSDGRPDRVWFAGHPLFGGVVSPVGGHYPVRVVAHVPRREPCGGPGFALALEVGLVRRSGKGTRT